MKFLRTLVMSTAFVASLNSFSNASQHALQDDSQIPGQLTNTAHTQMNEADIQHRTNTMLENLGQQLLEHGIDGWNLDFYKKQFSEGLRLIPLADHEDVLEKVIGITSKMKKNFCSFSSLIQATQKIPQDDRKDVLNYAVPFIDVQYSSGLDYIPLIISTIQTVAPDERLLTLRKAMPIFKLCPEYFEQTVKDVKSMELHDIEYGAKIITLSPKCYLSFNNKKYYYNTGFPFNMKDLCFSFIKELSNVALTNRRDVWLRSRPLFESYRFALWGPYVAQMIKAVSEVPAEECEDVFENVHHILG